eukprot:16187316-Heterocapsa_arctica.AAC.1
MVRVLRDFRRRRISPATRQRSAAVKRTSSGRQVLVKHSPCSQKGSWLGPTGRHVVPGCTHVEQAPQKVVGCGSWDVVAEIQAAGGVEAEERRSRSGGGGQ